MRSLGPVLMGAVATVAVTACDGSPSPHPSSSARAPVAIAACPASVVIPTDTTRAVPDAALPPTAVIRAGGALSIAVPSGSTLGLAAPLRQGARALLCSASVPAVGTVVLVGRQPGFARVALAAPVGRQRVVNVQVTV